jgi:ABC-type branched-chain amino acid transport system, permease component
MSRTTLLTEELPTAPTGGAARTFDWAALKPHAKRLVGCLFAGFVLALMVGPQEGSESDFGIAFFQATRAGRLLIFLALGLVAFLLITFWHYVAPYIRRPGALPVGIGFLAVLSAMWLMNWYDPVGKFHPLSTQVGNSSGVPFLTSVYFGLSGAAGWLFMVACLLLGGAAVITRIPAVGYAQIVLGLVAAACCFFGHQELVDWAGKGPDHSLGSYLASVGYLIYALAGLIAARSVVEVADPRGAIDRVVSWRPGLPVVGAGLVVGLMAFTVASWFAPQAANRNNGFGSLHGLFSGTGVGSLTTTYLGWLGWALFVVAVVAGGVGAYLRNRWLGALTAALGLVGLVVSFVSLFQMTKIAAKVAAQYGTRWQNLGVGGWEACLAFALLAIGGALTAFGRASGRPAPAGGIAGLPVHKFAGDTRRSMGLRVGLPVAIALALFYPPTLTTAWQSTIVTQIGVYILLTIGLNVVIGWAGLLDLGYIAFYAIGSYVTAYITGSLPHKPPSWLHLSPLWAIPFAIVACLIAGVLLGGPTLRLRGDYLAIVTLGFGEIIYVFAINNPVNITGGPQGPNVTHPVLDLGIYTFHFGLDPLPYWYLLMVFIIVVVILFYRLEGSRLGRAWAAIREDEVAARASGVNTMKVKLLAFSIGATTSGLAGVFYASQVGYFDPSDFTLQYSILIVAYVVFGGMGSLPGAIAGAAVLAWLPQFLKDQVPLPDRTMWVGAILLIMMIFRPAGLIPAKRRRAELEGVGEEASSSETSAVPTGMGGGV